MELSRHFPFLVIDRSRRVPRTRDLGALMIPACVGRASSRWTTPRAGNVDRSFSGANRELTVARCAGHSQGALAAPSWVFNGRCLRSCRSQASPFSSHHGRRPVFHRNRTGRDHHGPCHTAVSEPRRHQLLPPRRAEGAVRLYRHVHSLHQHRAAHLGALAGRRPKPMGGHCRCFSANQGWRRALALRLRRLSARYWFHYKF